MARKLKRIRVTETEKVMLDLLEWAKGNRGSKSMNPYLVPEVAAAMKHLAKRYGFKEWMDVSELVRVRNK